MLRIPAAPTALLALLLSLLLPGCEPADPLETIRQQQATGEVAGTIEPLRALLVERPKDPEANYLYGHALILTGQPSLATWALRQAMEDPAWLVPAGLELAQAFLITADFNETVEVTTRILEEHPDDAAVLVFRAQAQAHWKADPEAALADANRALELEPGMLEAFEPRILALLSLGRQEEARESLAEAGRRMAETDAPLRALAWHCSTTAVFAVEADEIEQAREQWEECLERYPADPTVLAGALAFFDAQAQYERSLEALRAAHAEAPEMHPIRAALAARLRVMGETAEGEALLREATEAEDPMVAGLAWSELALFRHAIGEHGAAVEALARAIERTREVQEPSEQLLFRYADALVVSGQLPRALEVAGELTVPAQAGLIRGRVAQERGDPVGALAEFDEALRLWPNNTFAHYYAALAAEQVGDFDRALDEYRYAVRIEVGATDARTRGAKLLMAQGSHPRAYQLLFVEVAKAPLEREGELVGSQLIARVANPKQLQDWIRQLSARNPGIVPEALARAAEGVRERAGPAAAYQLLATSPRLDLTPASAPIIRALVRTAHEAGEPEAAARGVEAALKAHPDVAAFHEIRGLHLELAGASGEEVRSAYARAVELDAGNAGALAGLGRLAAARNPDEAIALFDRAAAADPEDPAPKLAAARAVLAAGRAEKAARRLDRLLRDHPYAGDAAALRVSIDLEQGSVTARTAERANRAARFGGGPEGYERLGDIYERLDQPEHAAEATRRAELLRERLAPSS